MVSINWTNITNAQQFLAIANTQSGSWFWTATLFLVWGILVISMLSFGLPASILASSFACFTLGVLLTYLGLVNWAWTAFFMGWIIVMIFYKIFNSKD